MNSIFSIKEELSGAKTRGMKIHWGKRQEGELSNWAEYWCQLEVMPTRPCVLQQCAAAGHRLREDVQSNQVELVTLRSS